MSRVVGLGLDLVHVPRFAAALERHGEAFVRRICRPGEPRVAVRAELRTLHLAGLFAAKEATMKALGTGWADGVGFQQIEIVRDAAGAPALRLHGRAAALADELGVTSHRVSISHDGQSAAAVVILEGGRQEAQNG
ncbi:MAG: holo-ACP synthase [Thermoanaerobaculia bacterium]